MAKRFFTSYTEDDIIYLKDEEYHHLVNVMRASVGEQITVCFNDGTDNICEIISLNKNQAQLKVMERKKNTAEADISVTLWILNRNKTERIVEVNDGIKNYRNRKGEVLFIDLRQKGEPFEKKFIQFSEADIEAIAKTYHHWQQQDWEASYQDIPEYCCSATLKEIRKKDYSLVPSKYIEFVNRDESLDYDEQMKVLQIELKALFQQEADLKKEVEDVFKSLGYEL